MLHRFVENLGKICIFDGYFYAEIQVLVIQLNLHHYGYSYCLHQVARQNA